MIQLVSSDEEVILKRSKKENDSDVWFCILILNIMFGLVSGFRRWIRFWRWWRTHDDLQTFPRAWVFFGWIELSSRVIVSLSSVWWCLRVICIQKRKCHHGKLVTVVYYPHQGQTVLPEWSCIFVDEQQNSDKNRWNRAGQTEANAAGRHSSCTGVRTVIHCPSYNFIWQGTPKYFQTLQGFFSTIQCPFVSEMTYHSLKKQYVVPAISIEYETVRSEVRKILKENIEKVANF